MSLKLTSSVAGDQLRYYRVLGDQQEWAVPFYKWCGDHRQDIPSTQLIHSDKDVNTAWTWNDWLCIREDSRQPFQPPWIQKWVDMIFSPVVREHLRKTHHTLVENHHNTILSSPPGSLKHAIVFTVKPNMLQVERFLCKNENWVFLHQVDVYSWSQAYQWASVWFERKPMSTITSYLWCSVLYPRYFLSHGMERSPTPFKPLFALLSLTDIKNDLPLPDPSLCYDGASTMAYCKIDANKKTKGKKADIQLFSDRYRVFLDHWSGPGSSRQLVWVSDAMTMNSIDQVVIPIHPLTNQYAIVFHDSTDQLSVIHIIMTTMTVHVISMSDVPYSSTLTEWIIQTIKNTQDDYLIRWLQMQPITIQVHSVESNNQVIHQLCFPSCHFQERVIDQVIYHTYITKKDPSAVHWLKGDTKGDTKDPLLSMTRSLLCLKYHSTLDNLYVTDHQLDVQSHIASKDVIYFPPVIRQHEHIVLLYFPRKTPNKVNMITRGMNPLRVTISNEETDWQKTLKNKSLRIHVVDIGVAMDTLQPLSDLMTDDTVTTLSKRELCAYPMMIPLHEPVMDTDAMLHSLTTLLTVIPHSWFEERRFVVVWNGATKDVKDLPRDPTNSVSLVTMNVQTKPLSIELSGPDRKGHVNTLRSHSVEQWLAQLDEFVSVPMGPLIHVHFFLHYPQKWVEYVTGQVTVTDTITIYPISCFPSTLNELTTWMMCIDNIHDHLLSNSKKQKDDDKWLDTFDDSTLQTWLSTIIRYPYALSHHLFQFVWSYYNMVSLVPIDIMISISQCIKNIFIYMKAYVKTPSWSTQMNFLYIIGRYHYQFVAYMDARSAYNNMHNILKFVKLSQKTNPLPAILSGIGFDGYLENQVAQYKYVVINSPTLSQYDKLCKTKGVNVVSTWLYTDRPMVLWEQNPTTKETVNHVSMVMCQIIE